METILGRAEETVACRGCADMVFFGIVLHDFQEPYRVLSNGRLMLKLNGILVDLDWKKEETSMGPPLWMRFDERFASEMISRQGFTVISISESGNYHYIIRAEKT